MPSIERFLLLPLKLISSAFSGLVCVSFGVGNGDSPSPSLHHLLVMRSVEAEKSHPNLESHPLSLHPSAFLSLSHIAKGLRSTLGS